MIDLQKIQDNQISGLDSDELNFMDYLLGNDEEDLIFNQWTGLPTETELFDGYDLTEAQLNEIHILEEEAKSKSTERQTKTYVQKFKKFLDENKLPNNIEEMPIRYLESYLRLFFTRVRKDNHEHYAVPSLVCMRAAFHRYFLDKRQLEIIDNPSFHHFDKTYKASIDASLKHTEKLASEGGAGYTAIDTDDKKLLEKYFDRSTPERLQDEFFYKILYHFGFRGREWVRSLKKSSLKILEHGEETYIDLVHPNKEKNVKATNSKDVRQIIMTEMPDKSKCPVTAVKTYLSYLPTETLFPKPKTNWKNNDWYCLKEPLGKNSLNDMMKTISKRAKLSQTYTNHCIRSTVVTTLRGKGFSKRECMAVTGHKAGSSIDLYDKRFNNEKMTYTEKKKISEALSEGMNDDQLTNETALIIQGKQEATCKASTSSASQETCITREETHVFHGPPSKKMHITADGDRNVVTITFM